MVLILSLKLILKVWTCWQLVTSTTKKVLFFIATKGAGHTEPGEPYVAKWKDKNLNTLTREVARPEIVSKYF